MTEAPLPPQCQEARRRLAEGDADGLVFAHVAACPGCSAFAAALRDLDARIAALPLPEPPPGAVDRAVARFRAGFGASGEDSWGTRGRRLHYFSAPAQQLSAVEAAVFN